MTDFLIHELVWYPWLGWVLVILAGAGFGFAAVWVVKVESAVWEWLGYRREVWASKAAERRRWNAAPCVVCELAEEEIAEIEATMGDDPPEYQHPDEDGPGGMAGLKEILVRAHEAGMLDDSEGPVGAPVTRAGPLICRDPGCEFYGWVHPPPCKAAAGPAMPPVPWSGEAASLPLHPQIRIDLAEAGFGAHDYTEDIAESAYTAALAADVRQQIMDDLARGETIATVTDGVIPTDETGRSHRASSRRKGQ